MTRYLIGLTGGIASGKSLVGKLFEELGATVIDADRVVAECYESNWTLKAKLFLEFGPRVFSLPLKVNKERLAERVFSNKEKLSVLEKIVWPYVFEELEERINKAEGIIIIEATRLFESGYDSHLQDVITVKSLPGTQRWRLMHYRGFSREKADEIIHLQHSDIIKWPFTTYTIYNPTDDAPPHYKTLRTQVKKVWEQLLNEYEKVGE